jgi:hypothetical protein
MSPEEEQVRQLRILSHPRPVATTVFAMRINISGCGLYFTFKLQFLISKSNYVLAQES